MKLNKSVGTPLMNQYLETGLEKRLLEAIPYKLSPLKIKCVDKKNKVTEK